MRCPSKISLFSPRKRENSLILSLCECVWESLGACVCVRVCVFVGVCSSIKGTREPSPLMLLTWKLHSRVFRAKKKSMNFFSLSKIRLMAEKKMFRYQFQEKENFDTFFEKLRIPVLSTTSHRSDCHCFVVHWLLHWCTSPWQSGLKVWCTNWCGLAHLGLNSDCRDFFAIKDNQS